MNNFKMYKIRKMVILRIIKSIQNKKIKAMVFIKVE